MQLDLSGRVALVTGGSRGIGAAIVRALRDAGADVFFTYANRPDAARRLQDESGERHIAYERCDVAQGATLPGLVDACVTRFGKLDVLVNNAGTYAQNPFEGSDFEAWRSGWQRTFAVNLYGAADLAFLAMQRMRAQQPDRRGIRGRIVNITSRSAHRGEPEFPDYGASKGALANLTRSIARGCAKDGIVAFSVAPGYIVTDMAADGIAAEGDAIRAEIPSGRIGESEDVAGIVAFLASGLADYATGSTIDVNGASYVR